MFVYVVLILRTPIGVLKNLYFSMAFNTLY